MSPHPRSCRSICIPLCHKHRNNTHHRRHQSTRDHLSGGSSRSFVFLLHEFLARNIEARDSGSELRVGHENLKARDASVTEGQEQSQRRHLERTHNVSARVVRYDLAIVFRAVFELQGCSVASLDIARDGNVVVALVAGIEFIDCAGGKILKVGLGSRVCDGRG